MGGEVPLSVDLGVLFLNLVRAVKGMKFDRWGSGMFVLVREDLGFPTVGSYALRHDINWSSESWIARINAQFTTSVGVWVWVYQFLLHLRLWYFKLYAVCLLQDFLQQRNNGEFRGSLLCMWLLYMSLFSSTISHYYPLFLRWKVMANTGVTDLVVQLEESLDLSAMEHGVKLVGRVLATKILNRWGVRNILKLVWKEFGEVNFKWVRVNTFIISVQDETMAKRILDQVPWVVMKKKISVKKWLPDLAVEEVQMEMCFFGFRFAVFHLGLVLWRMYIV